MDVLSVVLSWPAIRDREVKETAFHLFWQRMRFSVSRFTIQFNTPSVRWITYTVDELWARHQLQTNKLPANVLTCVCRTVWAHKAPCQSPSRWTPGCNKRVPAVSKRGYRRQNSIKRRPDVYLILTVSRACHRIWAKVLTYYLQPARRLRRLQVPFSARPADRLWIDLWARVDYATKFPRLLVSQTMSIVKDRITHLIDDLPQRSSRLQDLSSEALCDGAFGAGRNVTRRARPVLGRCGRLWSRRCVVVHHQLLLLLLFRCPIAAAAADNEWGLWSHQVLLNAHDLWRRREVTDYYYITCSSSSSTTHSAREM